MTFAAAFCHTASHQCLKYILQPYTYTTVQSMIVCDKTKNTSAASKAGGIMPRTESDPNPAATALPISPISPLLPPVIENSIKSCNMYIYTSMPATWSYKSNRHFVGKRRANVRCSSMTAKSHPQMYLCIYRLLLSVRLSCSEHTRRSTVISRSAMSHSHSRARRRRTHTNSPRILLKAKKKNYRNQEHPR